MVPPLKQEGVLMKNVLLVVLATALALAVPSVTIAAPSLAGKWCGDVGGWKHTLTLKASGSNVSGSLKTKNGSKGGTYSVTGTFEGTRLSAKAGAARLTATLKGSKLSGSFAFGGSSQATYSRC